MVSDEDGNFPDKDDDPIGYGYCPERGDVDADAEPCPKFKAR